MLPRFFVVREGKTKTKEGGCCCVNIVFRLALLICAAVGSCWGDFAGVADQVVGAAPDEGGARQRLYWKVCERDGFRKERTRENRVIF